MVTQAKLNSLNYEDVPVNEADFVAGQDDQNQLQPNQVGEVAVAEVGEDGAFSDWLGFIGGQLPDDMARSAKGKAELTLKSDDADASGTPDDMPDGTEVRLIGRPKGSRDGTPLTPWITFSNNRPSVNVEARRLLKPQVPKKAIVGEGKVVAMQIRNRRSAITYYHTNSTWKWPGRAGTE